MNKPLVILIVTFLVFVVCVVGEASADGGLSTGLYIMGGAAGVVFILTGISGDFKHTTNERSNTNLEFNNIIPMRNNNLMY
jgi:hypothetical protein